ncbi:NADP-dependent oxidoreductase [Frondihabitans peucedani]|uniref:NADP-dependent oxidoreductase n=1 Tax=Frondihabitans peucedani TaxID=598626 RepID=A0ABP8E2X3_9MICO
MNRTFKAVEFDSYGDVGVLHLSEHEMPAPAADEILVEIVAAGLNHIENFIRQGDFAKRYPVAFPARQGSCFAGLVVKRGDAVKDLRVGDAVIGHAVGGGAHATHATVPRSQVVKKPDNIPWEVAGGLYLAGCTAYATVDSLDLDSSDCVVISAAAGGVGSIECQLALAAGAKVIGTCSPHNHDYLRSIGVVPVTYGEGIVDRIREKAGRPVTAFIDNFGGDNPKRAKELGVPKKRLRTSEERLETEFRFLAAGRDDPEPAQILSELVTLLTEQKVRILISGFYPFEYIAQAFDDMAEMHSRGKVVVGMMPVETGSRSSWYLSGKARTLHEVPMERKTPVWTGRKEA